MTNTSLYSHIGPFRGVPADLTRRIANIANAAAAGAYAAGVRKARETSPEVEQHDTFFTSPNLLTALDDTYFNGRARSRRKACASLLLFFFLSSPASIAASCITWRILIGAIDPEVGLPMIVILYGILSAFALGLWGLVGIPAWRALRELRQKGYLDETLPDAAADLAGSCWLLGNETIEISRRSDKDFHVTTVFYDAIAKAEVRIDNGGEVVDIRSRDGQTIACLPSPVAYDGRDATALASMINASVKRVRAKA